MECYYKREIAEGQSSSRSKKSQKYMLRTPNSWSHSTRSRMLVVIIPLLKIAEDCHPRPAWKTGNRPLTSRLRHGLLGPQGCPGLRWLRHLRLDSPPQLCQRHKLHCLTRLVLAAVLLHLILTPTVDDLRYCFVGDCHLPAVVGLRTLGGHEASAVWLHSFPVSLPYNAAVSRFEALLCEPLSVLAHTDLGRRSVGVGRSG